VSWLVQPSDMQGPGANRYLQTPYPLSHIHLVLVGGSGHCYRGCVQEMKMRTVNLGDVLCPDGTNAPTISDCVGGSSGFDVTDTSVPVAPGPVLNCTWPYTEVNGECVAMPYATSPLPPTMNPAPYPTSIPSPTLPSPTTACPNGMTLFNNAVCLPNASPAVQQQQQPTTSQIIPGVPNWMIYGIGGVLALMLLRGGKR